MLYPTAVASSPPTRYTCAIAELSSGMEPPTVRVSARHPCPGTTHVSFDSQSHTVTRTVHFGQPSQREKECFTYVLKGHISLDTAVFPNRTTGNLPSPETPMHAPARSSPHLHALSFTRRHARSLWRCLGQHPVVESTTLFCTLTSGHGTFRPISRTVPRCFCSTAFVGSRVGLSPWHWARCWLVPQRTRRANWHQHTDKSRCRASEEGKCCQQWCVSSCFFCCELCHPYRP